MKCNLEISAPDGGINNSVVLITSILDCGYIMVPCTSGRWRKRREREQSTGFSLGLFPDPDQLSTKVQEKAASSGGAGREHVVDEERRSDTTTLSG